MRITAEVVLRKLNAGWEMDRSGREGLAASLIRKDRQPVHVPFVVVGELLRDGKIVLNHDIGMYFTPEQAEEWKRTSKKLPKPNPAEAPARKGGDV